MLNLTSSSSAASYNPVISADGNSIAYVSFATDLVAVSPV